MCDLGNLFNTYGSDKDRNGYTPVYESLFKNIRTNDIALLEIGIGTMIPGVQSSMVGYALPGYAPGGSLRAWRDYFCKGEIVGIDIQPDTQFTDDRITTALANSSDKAALDAVLGDKTFTIIVDDGLHWDETQMATLRNLWDRVRPGGFYIIEDITEWSRIPTEFRSHLPAIVGSSPFFFTEKKNVLVISKA
jgi:hypothetical protein